MPRFKLSALISLLLVFLSGVLVGGVAHRLYTVRSVASAEGHGGPPPDRKQNPEDVRKRVVTEMRDRLHLDPAQVQRLDTIFDQTREQFDQLFQRRNQEARALRDNQNEQIRKMLKPEQIPLYEQLRAERDAQRRRDRDRDHDRGRGPGGPPRP
jgi:hypothetical protein